jgi:lysophospholipase L1-like esterase
MLIASTIMAAAVVGLVISEIGLRIVAQVWGLPRAPEHDRPETADPVKYYVHAPNTQVIFHPLPDLISGVGRETRFTLNSDGIRGRELTSDSEAEYRILAVGGSTTECLYLDDEKAWPFLLENMLGRTADGTRVWVGNVGKSGMNASDHVVQVKYLLPQLPRIDVVLLLVGINDLSVALKQGGQLNPQPLYSLATEQLQLGRAFALLPAKPESIDTAYLERSPWYRQTATWGLLRRARASFAVWRTQRGLVEEENGRMYREWRKHRQAAKEVLERLPDLTAALDAYRRNLSTIADLAQARSAQLVLLTQPSLWHPNLSPADERLLWLGGVGDFQREQVNQYYSVKAMTEGLRKFNETLLRVCAARRLACVDIASVIPQNTTMFYDDVHFTERGAQLVASTIAGYLREKTPFASLQGPQRGTGTIQTQADN